MNTGKTSDHKETFHTGAVVCCADGTKLLPLLMVEWKMMSADEFPCGFSCMSRLLEERMKRSEAVAMESDQNVKVIFLGTWPIQFTPNAGKD